MFFTLQQLDKKETMAATKSSGAKETITTKPLATEQIIATKAEESLATKSTESLVMELKESLKTESKESLATKVLSSETIVTTTTQSEIDRRKNKISEMDGVNEKEEEECKGQFIVV